MKTVVALAAIVLVSMALLAQSPARSTQTTLSPAEKNIDRATKLIQKNPKNFEAYNALALALSRRARESSDISFYAQAEDALRKSFEISPGNFDGEKIRVWLLLGKHDFAAALNEAKKLNKQMPNDVMVYAFLTDANMELGNYKDAETAAQSMLDLRAGTVPGLTRAAYLRELFGDIDGALELMHMAYESTPPAEVEDRAWILTQMAHLKLAVGKTSEAERLAQQALTIFPGYHYALGNLAKVRIQQRRFADAVQLLQQRYQAAPHAENLFELAQALQLAGQADEAQKAFAEFEKKSLLETDRGDNSNHELIAYYVDYAKQPTKALAVATRELARRHDIHTLDAYAWALYANGRYTEARKQIEAALAVGTRDAAILRHAAEIASRCGDHVAASRYQQQASESGDLSPEQQRLQTVMSK